MLKKNSAFRFFMVLMLVLSTLTTGILPVSAAESTFEDVPSGAYYTEAVGWAVDKGITNGTSKTSFSPEAGCNRGQCVTFLYRYAGSPDVDTQKASKFTDVVSDSFYESAVAWAVENEITAGTSESTFDPNLDCTRGQIVTFLWRYSGKPEVDNTTAFEDVKSDEYYADAVAWAVDQDITNGTSEKNFSPNQTCTRSQIVTFQYRMDQAADSNVPDGTITDSWEQIIASCNDGTYRDKYKIGDTKALDLGSEGVVEMQIAAFDADELADGSGIAAITWISKQLLKSTHQMNPTIEKDFSDSSKCKPGTGSIGGWANSEMRAWLKSDIKPLIPSVVRDAIKPVTKYSTSYDTSKKYLRNVVSTDDVWIPSLREVKEPSHFYETGGPAYTELFATNSNRAKQTNSATMLSWWLRSADYEDYGQCFAQVYDDGNIYGNYSKNELGVALGFCTGVSTELPSTVEYTVSFNTNDGSSVKSQIIKENHLAMKPEDPTKEGYNFAGWFSDSSLTKEYDFSMTVSQNRTLYAKWEIMTETMKIIGKVVDSQNNQPLEDVAVTIYNTNEDVSISAGRTDAEGLFSINVSRAYFDPYDYDIQFVKSGYKEDRQSITISEITDIGTVSLVNNQSPTDVNHYDDSTACTRALACYILWKASGSPEVGSLYNPYSDVSDDAPYLQAVLWATEFNITRGVTNTTFEPDSICNKGQVAAFIYRLVNDPVSEDYQCGYTDIESDAYYYEAVRYVSMRGWMNPVSDTIFGPDNTCYVGDLNEPFK